MLPDVFRPILQPRAAAMYHELGCESVRAPPLQSKGVENGKSAMSFLVPGGPGVQAQNAATYSLIIKQLNAQDVQLLPSLAAKLVPIIMATKLTAALDRIAPVVQNGNADGLFLTDGWEAGLAQVFQMAPENGISPDAVQYMGLTRWDVRPDGFNLPGMG